MADSLLNTYTTTGKEPEPIITSFSPLNLADISSQAPPPVPVSLVPPTMIGFDTLPQSRETITPLIPLSTLHIDTPTSIVSTTQNIFPTSSIAQMNNSTTITLEDVNLQIQPHQTTSIVSTVAKKSTGLWSWFANIRLLNKFAAKAKSSVDSMITTLDPGMKEFIYSGGDVRIFVATSNPANDFVVVQIRDIFQTTFGRATVTGEIGKATNIAPQSVGFSAALKAAEEKISFVQLEMGNVDENFRHRAFVATQDFVVELVPDRWYDVTCLVLRDHRFDGDLQVFSQPSAIPPEYVNQMQDSTPPDYPLRWSGFATTVGEASMTLTGNSNFENWRESVSGVSSKELLSQAAKSLACMYRRALTEHEN